MLSMKHSTEFDQTLSLPQESLACMRLRLAISTLLYFLVSVLHSMSPYHPYIGGWYR